MSDPNETSDANESTEPKEPKESGGSSDAFGEKVQDLRDRLKHLTQPLVDSLDSRLRDQIDRRVDDRVDDRVQTLVDEALADLIEKHKNAKPRAHVMGAYLASHEKYGTLYKKLAE